MDNSGKELLYNDGMEKITWIIDIVTDISRDSAPRKFTATKTFTGETSDISDVGAVTMANAGDGDHIFVTAQAKRYIAKVEEALAYERNKMELIDDGSYVPTPLEQYTGVRADWNTKSEYYHG